MSSAPSIRLLVAALAAAPAIAHAQESSALPFQPGRWAVELSGTGGSGNLGFLRFTSARGAWMVAPGLSVARGSGDARISDFTGDLSGDAESDFFAWDVRAGRRQYQGLGGGAVSFLGAGLRGFAEMANSTADLSDGASTFTQDIDDTAWGGGVYGEIGGSWFFTPRLGIGATAIVDLTVAEVRSVVELRDDLGNSERQEFESRDWAFDLAQTRLMVTIVF